MRLKDADALEKSIKDTRCYNFLCNGYDGRIGCSGCDTYNILKIIDDAPTVDHVRHGHWIPKETMVRSIFAKNYVCSECGEENFQLKFCSNCGAKMDEKGDC